MVEMRKSLITLSTIAALALYLAYLISHSGAVVIHQKGSDTLLIIAERWAYEYAKRKSGVEIVVGGGGSGTGIVALINGEVDIADASREIKAEELQAAEKAGVKPIEWKVAIDGISIIVNRGNPIDVVTLDQLRGIYNGSIRRWSEIGGVDAPIVAYGRQSTSGTYQYFRESVLRGGDYRRDMNQMAGNADIVEAVIKDPNGIGYVGVAYAEEQAEEVKILGVKAEKNSEIYLPTRGNIAEGRYPLARYLYLYTDGIPTGAVADYLRFILSEEGQKIVEEAGYIPMPRELAEEQLSRLGG